MFQRISHLINYLVILAVTTSITFCGHKQTFVQGRSCAVVNENQYLCNDYPDQLRFSPDIVNGHGTDLEYGVEQRIDGSKAEKDAVFHELELMYKYMNDEVMAKPEYAHVRGRCKNSEELCAFWASLGECENNRGFMLSKCAAVCRLCLLSHTSLN